MPNTSNNSHEKISAPAIRAYLGGSFDPVHNGHLEVALHAYQDLLPIAKQQNRPLHVSLLPNARSPFKTQSTDPKHRLAMLKLADKTHRYKSMSLSYGKRRLSIQSTLYAHSDNSTLMTV